MTHLGTRRPRAAPAPCASGLWIASRHPDEIDVWFTGWQVAEDGLNVELDERVEWAVEPMDQVSVRYDVSTGPIVRGWVPDAGGAMQHSVASFRERRAHHGKAVGWVVRVRAEGSSPARQTPQRIRAR